jgi:hypothetical protein
MPDESNELPTSRIVRWVALAMVIGFAVALYFRAGVRLAPLTAPPPPPPPPASPPPPATAQPAN